MRKSLFLLFLAALFATIELSAANKAFVSLREAPLYILNERGVIVETLPQKVAKGDTVYATSQTSRYLEEHYGERVLRFPVQYQGTKAYISTDDVHPIRLEATDTLSYLTEASFKVGSFREQKIIPAMEWAMNVTTNPMQWIYIALIALACGVGFRFLANAKHCGLLGLSLVGLSLAAMSGAEVMYFLSYEPHAVWFLQPSVVNGWGHVILNFIILAIVCGTQSYLFYDLWDKSFSVHDHLTRSIRKKDYDDEEDDDEEDDDESSHLKWIINMAWLPFIIGIAMIIFIFAKSSSTPFYISGALIVGVALCGALYQIFHGRLLPGIIFPICYIVDSVGLILMVLTLGSVLILVAIISVVAVLAISFILSLIGGVLGIGSRVDFVDENGRKHSGTKQLDGTVKGDDGNLYKPKD